MTKKVAIVYLLWSQEPYQYLERAIEGVKKQSYPRELVEFLIVYNSHQKSEKSACPFIREIIERNKENLPHATILEQEKNLGFVGGNNQGMRWAVDHNYDYVFLHNGDGYLEREAIEKLVEAMESDEKIGAAQSLILLHEEKNLINSAGNNFHFLGFAYCNLYRRDKKELGASSVQPVSYVSGAAMMMRVSLLTKYGLWDEDYFIYHDDLDYSLRLKMQGYKTVLVPQSLFYHQYKFSRNKNKYYLMERNRYAVMLLYFKWPTLFLLAPPALIMEIGLLFFAFKNGWLKSKIRAYVYWCQYQNWEKWLAKRKIIQKRRIISDRELLKNTASHIIFEEEEIDGFILRCLVNPALSLYKYMIGKLIFW